ncbi:MAG: restriction endonuclease subunit S [Eubacterium sp.]
MARGKKKETLTPEERLQVALVPESEQPYKMPGNWCWMRGSAFLKSMETKRPEGEVFRYIDIDSIDNKRQQVTNPKILQVKDAPSRASRKLRAGDTVFSMVRPYLMNIAYIDETISNSIASTGFYVCTPTENVNPLYLYYLMTSPYTVDGLNQYMKGDNSPSIRKDDIENYAYPIPPLPEQQRIVDRIESLFAKLDEAKQKAQEALDSFEARKAAILHKAFTGELTAQWRKEHGVGMESWSWIPLKKCGSWNGGGTPSMSHPEYWENGTLLWVTSKDMKSDLIEDTLMHTNMLGVENSSATYIEEPAVLFVMRSGILRRIFPVCMVKKPFTVNQDLKALVPTVDINLEYLFWACKANEKQILEKCMKSGTTVESINTAALRDFEIPIARKNEQTEIVRILDDLLAKEQQAKEAAEGVLEQIDLIKKAILARAFRGELGTNDPTEESAVELLKTIM